jgi:membrane-associated protease RseP (regulator of RpoE activity)
LSESFFDAIQQRGQWALLDRSRDGSAMLTELGVDAPSLRRASSTQREGALTDWRRVQAALSERFAGSLFALGVLGDDLVATNAQLWFLAPGPGPARPSRRAIELAERATIEAAAAALAPALEGPRPVLGAVLLDALGAEGPSVAHLRSDGPAARAGLELGDHITALAGEPVFTAAQVRRRLVELGAGAAVTMTVASVNGPRTVELAIGSSEVVVDAAGGSHDLAALAVEIQGRLDRESRAPRWVLQLNQAQVLLFAGDAEGAVRVLRSIDHSVVPSLDRPGLGEGALEYLLGQALEAAGPQYVQHAAAAYRRAASSQLGRLSHDDGPFVAPRARARLTRLGS